MTSERLLRLVQRYVANVAIGSSTLRNQGAKGAIEAARDFLAEVDLSVLQRTQPPGYAAWLDEQTEELRQELPPGARRWGTARKAINVFMVQASLNRMLAGTYGLVELAEAMEVPIDSQVSKALRALAGRGRLPTWPGVSRLTPAVNRRYQDFASQTASARGFPRPYLDMEFWRAGESRQSRGDAMVQHGQLR